eukprot:317154-Pleurochrysis_carterae.AAC.1
MWKQNGPSVRSVAWALHKVRRMGLAKSPPHRTCKTSIRWCLCESSHQRLAPVNAKLNPVPCAIVSEWALHNVRRMDLAQGRSVAWALQKVHRIELAKGPSDGACAKAASKGLLA